MHPAPSVFSEQKGPIFHVEEWPAAKGLLARLAQEDAEHLGLAPGDAITVTGARPCAGRLDAWSEKASGMIQLSPVLRRNAGTRVGERVAIEKVQPKSARTLVLAVDIRGGLATDRPSEGWSGRLRRFIRRQPALRDQAGGFLLPALEGTPLLEGDRLDIEWLGCRERVRIVETVPGGVVLADGGTTVSLVPLTDEDLSLGYDDIGGLGKEIARVREMVELPLYFPEVFERLGVEPPKGLLLYGPPGCGKTLIARAVARETRAHFLHVSGPEIIQKHYGESEEMLRALFTEAQQHPASIIFFDEIDALAPSRETVLGDVEKRVVAQLLALLDGVRGRGRVMVLAATNLPNNIDPALRRPGRLDREIAINPPDRAGRLEILQIHTRAMPLAGDVDLAQIAEVTHGFLGADLAALTREAAMLCARELPTIVRKKTSEDAGLDLSRVYVENAHFQLALSEIALSTTRQFGNDSPGAHWADIGGLDALKRMLRDSVEWPLRYGRRFDALHACPAKGILLTGASGTGKTLLARAVGTECGVNFISIKGPELISKWVGETERGIREVFKRARQSAPCILFFDELDALVPGRGNDIGGGSVSERMVGQFLLEMDNTDQRAGVLVLAATNRPELVDQALLRPGRFDLVLELPLPDEGERAAILEVHCRDRRLDLDVSLPEIAAASEGMSGAGLAELSRRAAMLAIGDSIAHQPGEHFDPIVVTRRHFLAAFAAAADRACVSVRQPGGSDRRGERRASFAAELAPAPSASFADRPVYFTKNGEET